MTDFQFPLGTFEAELHEFDPCLKIILFVPTITYVLLLSNPMSVQVPFCIEYSTQLMPSVDSIKYPLLEIAMNLLPSK